MSKACMSSKKDDSALRDKFLEILNGQDSINVTLRMVADFCLKLNNEELAKSLFLEALNKEHDILKEASSSSSSSTDTANSIFAQNLSDLCRYINFSNESQSDLLLGCIDDNYDEI